MLLKPILGLNRVNPPHELIIQQDGSCQCQELQNYISRDKKIKKIGGSEAYNATAISGAGDITWVHRSYHKRGDGTFRKISFCFSNGVIYYGNDVAGTLSLSQAGFTPTAIPTHASMQVSGNSILYLYIGEKFTDEVYKYDGNAVFNWEKTTLNVDLGRTIESAVVHLDRMWYVSRISSILTYSTTLKPEDLTTDAADIIIGQETDSIIRRIVVGGNETLYIFKNQSIWQLFGRTPATFEFRRVTNKYGLASKRGIFPVGGGFIFVNEFDKELYFFGGTETTIQPLTEKNIRLRDIFDITQIEKCCMMVHKGLLRFSYKNKADSIYQDRELIYALNEPGPDGTPKWSESKGAKIMCYSVWDQQGDDNELVIGRSDTGKLMYHNRTTNFDGSAIETIVRTAEVTASEDMVVRFKGFYIKGKPGAQKTHPTFEYFLNGRFSIGGSADWDSEGERRSFAGIEIPTQNIFNNRIQPLHQHSLGNSISYKISDNNIDTDVEIYSIAFSAKKRYKIRNELVGL